MTLLFHQGGSQGHSSEGSRRDQSDDCELQSLLGFFEERDNQIHLHLDGFIECRLYLDGIFKGGQPSFRAV